MLNNKKFKKNINILIKILGSLCHIIFINWNFKNFKILKKSYLKYLSLIIVIVKFQAQIFL